jgi:hypothetical protein
VEELERQAAEVHLSICSRSGARPGPQRRLNQPSTSAPPPTMVPAHGRTQIAHALPGARRRDGGRKRRLRQFRRSEALLGTICATSIGGWCRHQPPLSQLLTGPARVARPSPLGGLRSHSRRSGSGLPRDPHEPKPGGSQWAIGPKPDQPLVGFRSRQSLSRSPAVGTRASPLPPGRAGARGKPRILTLRYPAKQAPPGYPEQEGAYPLPSLSGFKPGANSTPSPCWRALDRSEPRSRLRRGSSRTEARPAPFRLSSRAETRPVCQPLRHIDRSRSDFQGRPSRRASRRLEPPK